MAGGVGEVFPAVAADFTSMLSLDSLTVKGLGAGNAVINSNVVAWNLGTIVTRNVLTANGGTQFGVVGHSVASYSRLLNAAYLVKKVAGIGPAVVDAAGDYVARLV